MVSSARILCSLAAAMLAASCTVVPTATPTIAPASLSPSLPAPTASQPTDAPSPTPAATVGPPIGTAWEPTTGIVRSQVFHTQVRDVAPGPGGFVAVGTACPGNPCRQLLALSWFSADGRAWTEVEVEDGAGVELITVAADDSTWYAAGVWHEDGAYGPRTEGRVWRSADAQSWTLAGKFPIGECFEGCPGFEQLTAGPGGLVMSWVHTPGDTPSTASWSRDGWAWTPIDKAMLGVPRNVHIPASEVVVLGGQFVMVGAHGGCASVWSSNDGRDWTVDEAICPVRGDLDVATNGVGAVVVAEDCSASDCVTRTFWSENARTGWTQSSQFLPITFPQLTYARSTFILTGATHPDQALAIYTSTDGVEWVEVDHSPGFDDCLVWELVDDRGRALFLGGEQRECSGVWISEAPAF